MLRITRVGFQVYRGQSNFIDGLTLTSTFSNFGLPVDNLGSNTGVAISSQSTHSLEAVSANVVSDWDLFVAAMTSDQSLRTDLISRVHNRASYNVSTGVFPTEYNSTSGSTTLGAAR